MEAHGDELPFDNLEADQPVGFIKIEPPVDFTKYQTEKPIKLSVEQPKEEKAPEKKPEKVKEK